MARTTQADVLAIIEVDSTITDLTPFIMAANVMVNAQCDGIDEDSAKLVETWLAAHFITIRDNRVSSEGVSDVVQHYQFKLDLGLSCSMYGQTAMTIDPTGKLAKWNTNVLKGTTSKKVSVSWMGTLEGDIV